MNQEFGLDPATLGITKGQQSSDVSPELEVQKDPPKKHLDNDSNEFRIKCLPNLHTQLETDLANLKTNLPRGQQAIVKEIKSIDSSLGKVLLDDEENAPASEDTVIRFALGIVIWCKPDDADQLFDDALVEMVDRLYEDHDSERFAKGLYLLTVLTHRHKNGNGRRARSLKCLADKMTDDNSRINEEETKTILGIDRPGVVQTGETTFSINVHPDHENMTLGVCYFALSKGIPDTEVVDVLRLNQQMPEIGLTELSKKLGVSLSEIKADFVRYMAIDSELDFCKFPI